MNASAAVRAVMSADDTLADPRGVVRSERLTDDDEALPQNLPISPTFEAAGGLLRQRARRPI